VVRRLALIVLVAACGGDSHAPDAPIDTPPIDTQPVFPACREFAGPSIAVPANITGALAASDVQSPSQCATIDAPYGVQSAGPDAVVRLEGLIPGTAYWVRLVSNADLAFYVATACTTASGPAAADCALFVDASADTEEIGRFVAQTTGVFVVVDFWATGTPVDQTFALEVYTEACASSAQCGGSTPVCEHGTCKQCVTSFDCASVSAPRCETTTNLCVAGADACTSDDGGEPANDGPAGATPIALDGSGAASIGAQICSSPRTEAD
jgi:hypothetical protein